MEYRDFLRKKQMKSTDYGFGVKKEKLNPNLFDWQREVVRWALKKGRAALFEDCGLGKTLQSLSFADEVVKHTGGKVLILAPLAVSEQTKREGEKFGISVHIARNQKEVQDGINITNYEMLKNFDPSEFVGVVLDESSILKSYMGKTKMQILEAFQHTPYKLSCTATPSPNDHMEILNQAEFLGIMRSSEALAIWFINDTQNMGTYRLKKHAIKPFWEWVSTWAICMSKPSDIGFSDDGYLLPELEERMNVVKISELDREYKDGLLRDIKTSATAFHQEKRYTAEARAEQCAYIAQSDQSQYVIWCDTNYEAEELKKLLPEAVEIRGSDKLEHKEKAVKNFIEGKTRILISKPSILGYGLNFQNCHKTIFCGMSYSYENYYQAVRRFHRFGQQNKVEVDIVIGSTEQKILESIQRKQKLHQEMSENMYKGIKQIQSESIKGTHFVLNLQEREITLPSWMKQ